MLEDYYINEFGIYFLKRCYGDDLEPVYMVKFGEERTDVAFEYFVGRLRKEGADENMKSIRGQFKEFFKLISAIN